MDDILALVTDLFFQSRIAATARHAGRTVRFVTGAEPSDDCVLALVDLDATSSVIEAIAIWRGCGISPIVAFGPHVDEVGRHDARTAGAHRVLAKSRFVSQLPTILGMPPTTQA